MAEVPKRLAPTPETLRELFLMSGNLCAFPGCSAILMDAEGTFVGQLCHIEAAEPGGERFNSSMTNEDRRAASNLMLMCYPHHRITNDVKRYTAEELRRIKAAHELRFSRPDRAIRELVAKAKWTSLVGAGAVAGAGITDIVGAFKSMLSGSSGSPASEPTKGVRSELVQRLRLAPVGVVHYYSRDPLHLAVGDQFLAIFEAAGWTVSQLSRPPLKSLSEERGEPEQCMFLLCVVSQPNQLSNAKKAIDEFFDACGFAPATPERPAERQDAGHLIRFFVVVTTGSE